MNDRDYYLIVYIDVALLGETVRHYNAVSIYFRFSAAIQDGVDNR